MSVLTMSLLLNSCEKPKTPEPEPPVTPDPKIEVTQTKLTAEAAGADYEVTYSITNPTETGKLTATCSEQWVTSIDCSSEGKVTFTVLPNETETARTAEMVLKYESVSATVTIEQAGKEKEEPQDPEYDVDIEMPLFYGIYYGEYFVKGVGNYWFYLMDKEMVSDVMSPEGNYYRIDLYAPLADDPDAAFVPDGTYTYDTQSSCASGTFTKSYSYLVTTDASGKGKAHDYTEGVLTVKNEGGNCSFELIVTIEGKKHRVRYSGPAPFTNDSSDEPDVDYPQIKEDINMNVVNADAYWSEDNNGVAAIDLRFMDMEKDSEGNPAYPGTLVDIDLFCTLDGDGSIKPGKYTISDNAGTDGTLAKGSISSIIGIMIPSGTNVQQYDKDGNRSFGPVTGGSFTISGNADEATVEIDFTMEGKHSFKATYSGPLPVKNIPTDNSSASIRASKRF